MTELIRIYLTTRDQNLTKNFNITEIYEWPYRLSIMSAADRPKANKLAIEALTMRTLINAMHAAIRLQSLRDHLNMLYPGENIYILVTSWLRHDQWEKYRGRNGFSTHTQGHATDIVPMGKTITRDQLLDDAENFLNNLQGCTERHHTFIHHDLRGYEHVTNL